MNVLVTGASGFVGRALVAELVRRGHHVRGVVRRDDAVLPADVERMLVRDADSWDTAMSGMDAVVHLAARVHVMRDDAADPLAEFRRVNVDLTRDVANAAVRAGIRQLVFLSTVKVLGEDGSFDDASVPCPVDPYGRSKLEAEQLLEEIGRTTGMAVTIIRPPLVYGPGAGGNFRVLLGLVRRAVPLPLGMIRNRRSLVALDNLVDFTIHCLEHASARGQTFLISDGHDMSTPELVKRLSRAAGARALLLPVPPRLLTMAARLLGRGEQAARLTGNLQVDISRARGTGWDPPVSVDEGLRRAASGGR